MEIVRLLESDGSLEDFDRDWEQQCADVGEECDSFGHATLPIIRKFAEDEADKEWAIALQSDEHFMAAATAIRTRQKGYTGPVLRIREVTVCPLLDYGNMDDNAYVDTLIDLLTGALKLSERELMANHIKFHLRSPTDAVFFRAFRKSLDEKNAFEATEVHGAWLTFSKASTLQAVK